MAESEHDMKKEDYLMVTLNDKGAILDVMGKLRECYPNVLHVERPQFTAGADMQHAIQDHRKMSEVELFESYFQEMTGDVLLEQELHIFSREIEDLHRKERETTE